MRTALQDARDFTHALVLRIEIGAGLGSGESLDPADTGSDSAFRYQGHETDIPGALHMCATAQFQRIGLAGLVAMKCRAHGDNTDLVTVFLAEKRHGPGLDGIVHRHQAGFHRRVLQDDLVGDGLDPGQFLVAHRLGMGEIEAQPLRRNQGAFLRHMGAKHLAQGLMHQVGGGMVGAHGAAPGVIHLQLQCKAGNQFTLFHGNAMHEQAVGLLLGVGDADRHAGAQHLPGVAHLTAAFAIKGCLVENDETALARRQFVDFPVVGGKRRDNALGGFGLITEKIRRPVLFLQREPHRFRRRTARTGPGRTGLGLLPLHGRVEAFRVDGDVAGTQSVLGQIERKAEGVVKFEGGFPVEPATGGQVLGRTVEQAQSALQGLAETGFLQLQRLGDQRLCADQLRIGAAHFPHQRRHQPVHQRFGGPQQVSMAHAAAHDPAQHVTAPFIGGQHAVGDQETGGAQVIGNHPVAGQRAAAGVHAGLVFGGGNQCPEQIDIIIVVHALQHGRQPLYAHAGVDGRPWQIEARFRRLLVLHEDQVPDLDEPVTVFVRRSRRAAPDVLAMVIEDLRTRTAGPRVAHRPEIVRCRNADDPVVAQTGDLLPVVRRLGVFRIDRDQQPVGRQAEFPGNQVPGQLDSPVLEIVAEGEVAEHFEERMVAGGVPNIVQIIVLAACADHLLRGGRPGIGPFFQTGENILELVHARVREHQRRVVARDQRSGLDHLVIVFLEIVQKGRSDFIYAGHSGLASVRHRSAGLLTVLCGWIT
ncbi:hypothetical protein [Labrenzia sp. 011]|uniref:hypothetical protein n=1 Tax=Labrenzia sp. 011 TaxID=2171494 RepID=UPI001FCCB767|nr:hypothetical protein [Labrenzia sp. 011]